MRRFLCLFISLIIGVMFIGSFPGAYAAGENHKPVPIGGKVIFRIDKSNLDQYKNEMPFGLVELIKDWNYHINVYDTVHDFVPAKQYIEATEKYKGTARIDKQGGLIHYTAGLPFPDPKTGLEVMNNYEYKYSGDDFWWTYYEFDTISSTGQVRKVRSYYKRLQYQGRVIEGPIPNPDKVEFKDILGFNYPEDIAGLALLTVRYQDPNKQDDGWMYIPTIRRVRRISTAQRSDTFGGTDYTWDDARGLSGKVAGYNWTLIGKKKMFVQYHALTNRPKIIGKTPNPDDLRYELREVYVVDGVNKDKDYSYGKVRFYVDPDSWAICANDIYDRRGRLWKYNEVPNWVDKVDHVMSQSGQYIYDLIAKRSTLAIDTVLKTNVGLTPADFTVSKLRSQSR